MDYRYTVFTKVLEEQVLRKELSLTLDLLKEMGLTDIDILFGHAWGLDYNDWTPYSVPIDQVLGEIEKVEGLGIGSIGHDDFILIVPKHGLELVFCHESDIHLQYNEDNELVDRVIRHWTNTSIFHVLVDSEKENSG